MNNGRVDIVGGGIAGLLAAIELASANVEVAVWESAGEFGGRARTRDVGGFLFNRGPHALYCQGALKRELDRLGIRYAGGRSLARRRQAIARGRLHDLPTAMGSIFGTSLLSLREKLDYALMFKAVMDGASGTGSFADWLDARRLSPRVRATVEAVARLSSYVHAPAEVSAHAMLDQIRLASGGTMYLDGGWGTLVDGLADAARRLGVALHPKTTIGSIHRANGHFELAFGHGDSHRADAVILAVGPREAAALAPEVASLQEEAREARTVRASTLDLGLSGMPPQAHDFALGIDAPCYLSVHSGSARLAPEGGALIHIARYLAVGEAPSEHVVEELEAVGDLVMPGWRERVVTRQKLRGMVVSNALPRFDRPRAAVRVPDAEGVFLAGDWVGEEGMIGDAAAASAIRAARGALRWLEHRQPLAAVEPQSVSSP